MEQKTRSIQETTQLPAKGLDVLQTRTEFCCQAFGNGNVELFSYLNFSQAQNYDSMTTNTAIIERKDDTSLVGSSINVCVTSLGDGKRLH